MSSDDGWILRNNSAGKFVLQHYMASNDEFPNVEDPTSLCFDTLEEAIIHHQTSEHMYPSEYGLTTRINSKTLTEKEPNKMAIHIVKAIRKEFSVDAVQVTAENMEEVARWCRGKVKTEQSPTAGPATPTPPTRYIHVRVLHPLNPKQTQAYVTDWVLVTDTGSKVYSDKAYKANFREVADEPVPAPATTDEQPDFSDVVISDPDSSAPVEHNVFADDETLPSENSEG